MKSRKRGGGTASRRNLYRRKIAKAGGETALREGIMETAGMGSHARAGGFLSRRRMQSRIAIRLPAWYN